MKISWMLSILVIFLTLIVFVEDAKAALQVAQGSFAKSTDAAPVDQSISGLGFSPKAIIFYYSNTTAAGFAAHSKIGFGFTNGSTAERGVAFVSDDAAARSDTARIRSESSMILIIDDGSNTVASSAAVLKTLDSDGFTITWNSNTPANTIIHYIALGGTDITNSAVGTFTLTTGATALGVTDLDFKPDFVMFLWTFTEAVDTGTAAGTIGIGFAKNSTSRGALVIDSEDNPITMDTWQQQRGDQAILLLTPTSGAQDAIADFTSMDDNGFTVTKSDGPAVNTPIFYL